MSARILVMFCLSCILALGAAPLAQASGQLVIHNQSNKVYSGLNIPTTKKGRDCIQIINSTNISNQNSQIGPCGGNGIHIYNNTAQSSQIYIYDSYIHPETHTTNCCDNNDGIFVQDGVSQVTVQENVIAYGESNVEVLGVPGGSGVNGMTITGNFLLKPRGGQPSSRGQNVSAWYASNVVQNNYSRSVSEYSEIAFQKHNGLCVTWNQATACSTTSDSSDTFLVENR